MSAPTWLALGLVVATSLAMLTSVNAIYALWAREPLPGRRTRRRVLRRVGTTVGLWQISVGIAIIALGPGTGWPSAIAVGGMGCMFLTGSWLARKIGVAPWWAPE